MDIADSRAYDSYLGGMSPGTHYSNNPNTKPVDRQDVPGVGETVKHRLSGETGQVTGLHVHGHTGERMPMVRWAGQPATGFTSDQGYSLDSLTTP
jgi:hypothetical protein